MTSSVSGKRSPAELTALSASPRCYQSLPPSARRRRRANPKAPTPRRRPATDDSRSATGSCLHTPKDDTYDRPEPKSADLIAADPATVLPWELVRDVLKDTRLYWLATVHPTAALTFGGRTTRCRF